MMTLTLNNDYFSRKLILYILYFRYPHSLHSVHQYKDTNIIYVQAIEHTDTETDFRLKPTNNSSLKIIDSYCYFLTRCSKTKNF